MKFLVQFPVMHIISFGSLFILGTQPRGVICAVEVLQTTDPQYVEAPPVRSEMFQQGTQPTEPYVRMLEQPAPKALRFRYECEGRSAGSIPGVNSTPDNKTFPTIQVST